MSLKFVTNGLRCLRFSSGTSFGQSRMFGMESVGGTSSLSPSVELPPKPKRPLSPYFRFMAAVRPECKAANPNASSIDLIRMIAIQWDKLDTSTKEKYMMAYKRDKVSYEPLFEKYKKSLTPEQKDAQKQMKIEKEVRREEANKRKRNKELGKPKRPANAFFRYLMENTQHVGVPVKERQETTSKLGEKWRLMSDKEKEPYVKAYVEDMDNFLRLLAKWEEKMLKKGNEDLVRISSLMQNKRNVKKAGKAV